MKKRVIACLTAIFMILIMCGCQEEIPLSEPDSSLPENYPLTEMDITFESAPTTVISLSPAVTEMLFELGFGNALVGRGSYCDYPEEAAAAEDVGSAANPNVKRIVEIHPELLVSQSPIANKDVSEMNAAGIKVLILPAPNSFNELKENYRVLLAVFGGKNNAETDSELAVSQLAQALMNTQKSGSFAYLMTYDYATATPDTFAGEILSYFGDNIAEDCRNYDITIDELTARQPDYLLIAAPLNIANFPEEINNLDAVKNGRVIIVDNTCFERPTVRRIYGFVSALSSQLSAPPAETPTPPAETSPEETTEINEENTESTVE